MDISAFFPVWNNLEESDRDALNTAAIDRNFLKGEILHRSPEECTGLILVRSGKRRAYTVPPEGK